MHRIPNWESEGVAVGFIWFINPMERPPFTSMVFPLKHQFSSGIFQPASMDWLKGYLFTGNHGFTVLGYKFSLKPILGGSGSPRVLQTKLSDGTFGSGAASATVWAAEERSATPTTLLAKT